MSIESKMLFRSFIAYSDFWESDVKKLEGKVGKALYDVQKELGFNSICWGPSASRNSKHFEVLSDSLAYILKECDDEYTIVIRGTNPFSISSWIFQDLNVSGMTPWMRQSPNTKSKHGSISKATDSSLGIHKKLTSSDKTILEWLVETIDATSPEKKIILNVTGHSLGGLLCGTLAYYLMDELINNSKRDRVICKVYGFAGPTAGDSIFAENLLKSMDNYNRYTNYNDIATHVWNEEDMKDLPDLYISHNIKMKPLEKDALDFFKKEVSSLDYTQPGIPIKVETYFTSFTSAKDYFVQAAYQHVVPYLLWGLRKFIISEIDDKIPNRLENLVKVFIKIIEHLIHKKDNKPFLLNRKQKFNYETEFIDNSFNDLTNCITDIKNN